MSEKPILFNGGMVRAIIDGRKTQTRRVVKPQPPSDGGPVHGPEMYEPVAYDRYGEMFPGPDIYGVYEDSCEWGVRCPYGRPGDRLWVRESTYIDDAGPSDIKGYLDIYHVNYNADGHSEWRYSNIRLKNIGSKPSIHMSRFMSRIDLDVTSIRVDRLQDITKDDAISEGMGGKTPCIDFALLWDDINEKGGYGWDTNPWVWVVEFEQLDAIGLAGKP
jgi:hypothetical protein